MSSIKVLWTASDKLLREELARDGRVATSKRVLEIELTETTPEQRLELTELIGFSPDGAPLALNIREYIELIEEYPHEKTQYIKLDTPPDVATVIELARMVRFKEALRQQHRHEQDQDYARHRKVYDEQLAILKRLAETDDQAAIDALRGYQIEVPDWYDAGWRNRYTNRTIEQERTSLIGEIAQSMSNRRAEAEKARKEAERLEWIAEHGSEHLKDAMERDYEVGRLYTMERFRHEVPEGWTIDYYDNAMWKERTNPSQRAMQVLKDAEQLSEQLGAGQAIIKWLTTPPRNEAEEDEYWFEPCEAVVIHGYLGKYDLVIEI